MIFNSITYLLFLPAFAVLYWRLPRLPRRLLIFTCSLLFYGLWRLDYVPVMMGTVTLDYFAGRLIQAASSQTKRRLYLAVSLSANLAILFYFKYTTFAVTNLNDLLTLAGAGFTIKVPNIILPLGISFYTFQSISYTVDVYRRFIPAERNYLVFVNYDIFFPQLVAGPILRGREVLHQLVERPPFHLGDIAWGARRVLFGLFLKSVLADNIAPLVDDGFAVKPSLLSGFDVWTLAFLFGLQIYFDFSAYSHIAIGSARILGIRFPENFNFPYLATSPRDFWRRWHISLSSWIRDYLYLPLCRERVRDESVGGLAVASADASPQSGSRQRLAALFVTWTLMGLWHGANWTYVLWGLWHATLISIYRLLPKGFGGSWVAVLGWMVTLPLVMLAWVPFRASSLSDTFTMLAHVINPSDYMRSGDGSGYGLATVVKTLSPDTYLATAVLVVLVTVAGLVHRHVLGWLERRPWALFTCSVAAYAAMASTVLVFLRPVRQFIYFQF